MATIAAEGDRDLSKIVTPAASGFHMPAEWAPHARCWMAWPCRTALWYGRERQARSAYAAVARAISLWEPLTMLARPEDREEAVAACGAGVEVLAMPLDDSWMRDSGPTFLVNGAGEVAGADWRFNAWGGKFLPFDQDAAVAGKVLEELGMRAFQAPFVLEGGSIHVDGEGTCITTEECLLNPNRNPGLSRREIERLLGDYLGIEKVIWVPRGVFGDETDGHVDNLACFSRPGRVLLTWSEKPDDPQTEISREARRVLESSTDARGRQLAVGLLPSPGPLFMTPEEASGIVANPHAPARRSGDRLAGSYVNFLITSTSVVYPHLDPRHDDEV